jgi:hypothetical protein
MGRQVPLDELEVRAADGTRRDPDEQLARTGCRFRHVAQAERAGIRVERTGV